MKTRARRLLTAAVLLALPAVLAVAAGCSGDDVAGPGDVTRLGIVEFHGDGPEVTLPASATIGEEFTVTVRTFGGGCTSKGPTRVDTVDAVIRILPLDVVPDDPDAVCPAVLRIFEHQADLAFEEAGERTVRIVGRRVDGEVDEVIQLNRTVTVETAAEPAETRLAGGHRRR